MPLPRILARYGDTCAMQNITLGDFRSRKKIYVASDRCIWQETKLGLSLCRSQFIAWQWSE